MSNPVNKEFVELRKESKPASVLMGAYGDTIYAIQKSIPKSTSERVKATVRIIADATRNGMVDLTIDNKLYETKISSSDTKATIINNIIAEYNKNPLSDITLVKEGTNNIDIKTTRLTDFKVSLVESIIALSVSANSITTNTTLKIDMEYKGVEFTKDYPVADGDDPIALFTTIENDLTTKFSDLNVEEVEIGVQHFKIDGLYFNIPIGSMTRLSITTDPNSADFTINTSSFDPNNPHSENVTISNIALDNLADLYRKNLVHVINNAALLDNVNELTAADRETLNVYFLANPRRMLILMIYDDSDSDLDFDSMYDYLEMKKDELKIDYTTIAIDQPSSSKVEKALAGQSYIIPIVVDKDYLTNKANGTTTLLDTLYNKNLRCLPLYSKDNKIALGFAALIGNTDYTQPNSSMNYHAKDLIGVEPISGLSNQDYLWLNDVNTPITYYAKPYGIPKTVHCKLCNRKWLDTSYKLEFIFRKAQLCFFNAIASVNEVPFNDKGIDYLRRKFDDMVVQDIIPSGILDLNIVSQDPDINLKNGYMLKMPRIDELSREKAISRVFDKVVIYAATTQGINKVKGTVVEY